MGEIIRVTVRGRVQGVGFRYYTRDEAARLGVAGWVRNLPNGDVEVVARVTPARKQRLLAALQAGPPLSAVTAVEVETLPDDPGLPGEGFAIRR